MRRSTAFGGPNFRDFGLRRGLRFVARLACAALILSAPLSTAAAQPPQVSETERAAARQLYREGADLQQQGKYAEALDKFEKAQKVYPAPTNLLRIAQCQAMLGRLVESAESYRAVIRTELPPGSPTAFHQAIEEAKAEVGQVEPRVPKVKIDVTPANAANLEVRLDGKSVNAALIGEPLPLDPGTHTIAVTAPGYSHEEQSVTLKERDTKSLAFALKPAETAGVVAAAPAGTTTTTERPPPPPPPIERAPTPAETTRAKRSLLAGIKLGLDFPGGNLVSNNGSAVKLGDVGATGAAGGIEAGIRLWDHWYFSLFYEAAGFGQGSSPGSLVGRDLSGIDVSSSVTSGLGGLDIAYISNAHGLGLLLDLGVAYRALSVETKLTQGAGTETFNKTYSGGELLLGAGAFIKATPWLRIVPKLTAGLGPFSHVSTDCSSTGGGLPAGPTCTSASGAISASDQSGHAFVFLGVSGLYNLDLK